jgi:hypothetical protein
VDDQLRVAREALPGFEPQTVELADRGVRAVLYGKTGGTLARERTSYVAIDTATGGHGKVQANRSSGSEQTLLTYRISTLWRLWPGWWARLFT